MSTKVIKADYYFIAPIRVTDWALFSQEFDENKGWSRATDANEFSLKEQIVGFLGMEKKESVNSIVAAGEKWTRELQKSGNKAFSYYKGDIKLFCEESVRDDKDKVIDRVLVPIAGCNEELTPSLILELYISPNKKNALAVLCLILSKSATCTFEDVVNTSYHLHKTDIFRPNKELGSYQAPILFVKTGFNNEKKQDIYEYKEECLTLAHVLKAALPSTGYELDNPARFHTATFVKIDATIADIDDNQLTEDLVHLGQSKDYTYDISEEEKNNVVHLFENIWTYNSLEGFGCVVKSHGEKDPDFIINSESTFKKSYLPLFLTTLMADITYTSALRHLNEVAMYPDEQDRLREARLSVTLSVSHYDHLNRLMKSMVRNRDFEAKYTAIQSSIDSRRMQLENERAHKEDARDRRINFLLGFIGIGQVVFAILQLLGANNVMGICVADSSGLKITSIVMLAIFTALIVYLLARLFTEKRRKNN